MMMANQELLVATNPNWKNVNLDLQAPALNSGFIFHQEATFDDKENLQIAHSNLFLDNL